MIRIRVVKVKEMKNKDGHGFLTYKTVDKNGKLMDLKFRREVKNAPEEPCTLLIESPEDFNVDTTKQWPCVWVRKLAGVEATEHKSNASEFFELGEEDKAAIDDILG